MGLMLGLPELLQARGKTEKSCIFIMQQGGPSHIDTFDLKPNAPAEIRGPYQPIATSVPGIQVGELLPRLAKRADRYCVIRSMTTIPGEHPSCVHAFLAGSSQPQQDDPYLGSVLSKLRPSVQRVPSYVWLTDMFDSGPRFKTGGFLGSAHAPMHISKDPSAPDFKVTAFDPPAGVTAEQVRQRRGLRDALEASPPAALPGAADRFRQVQEKAFDLVTGSAARQAFDIAAEPDRVRDRYGRGPLGQNLLLARRLIEAGVRLVSLHAWTGVPPGYKLTQTNNWDMHGGQSIPGDPGIFGKGTHGLGWCLPHLDRGVSALLDDLQERGLLDDTLVVMAGEFGRTPQIDTKGVPGRHHWSSVFSALLAGGGIRGGLVYGASDRIGGHVKDKPVKLEDFSATLLHALDVSPETRLAPDGFTRPASTGAPILDLFGG
jgi:hypothetical protein